MVIRHSPTPSGELQIYYTHAAVSRMLSLRWCPVLGSQLPVNTEGWRTPDCLFVSRQHSGPFLPQSHFTLLEECFACATNLFLPKHVFLCHTYWEPVTNQFFRRTGTVTLLWHCAHMCERDCEEWRTCIFYMILQLQHKQKVRSVILCLLVWMKLQSFFCVWFTFPATFLEASRGPTCSSQLIKSDIS